MYRRSIFLHAGWLAGAVFAAAVVAAGAAAAGSGEPVHLLGPGMARLAPWFDWLGFLLPGVLLLGFALAAGSQARSVIAGRAGGVATSLLIIAGLAFASIGLLPFDPGDTEGARSRLHSMVVVVAILAMIASLPLGALAAWRSSGGRGMALVLLAIAAAMVAVLFCPPTHPQGGPVLAQRLLLGLFFAGPACLSVGLLRRQPPL